MTYRSSRLKRVEEKQAVRSTAKYIVLTIVLIVALFIFGLPAISKLAAFMADIVGQEAGDTDNNTTPPPPPHIDNPPLHTKESSLKLTGSTRPGYTASIFFNDEKTEVLANASGEFTGIFELSKGENALYAYVTDSKGLDSTNTRTFIVNYDSEPPKLEIISPENGKQFFRHDNQAKIEGQTEADAKVVVNDRIAIVRSDGKFDFAVTLVEGENIFKVKSTDRAGNEVEIELKLTYSP